MVNLTVKSNTKISKIKKMKSDLKKLKKERKGIKADITSINRQESLDHIDLTIKLNIKTGTILQYIAAL